MRPRQFLAPAVVLFVGLFLWSPTPAMAQPGVPCSQCSCSSSCDTMCYYTARPGELCIQHMDYPELCYTNCQNWGLCTTSPGCSQTCSNLSCTTTTTGTSGNDTLFGGSGRDCIHGGHGNDVISGGGGDDRLYGNSGNDDLYGESGNDCMWGGTEDDLLDGGNGYDFGDGEIGTYDSCTASTEVQTNC